MKFDLDILDPISSSELESYNPSKVFKGFKVKLVGLHKKRATLLVKIKDEVRRLTLSENLTNLVNKKDWKIQDVLSNAVILINQDGVPFLASKPDMEGGWETV